LASLTSSLQVALIFPKVFKLSLLTSASLTAIVDHQDLGVVVEHLAN
jgi:hypothetical protein